MQQPVEAVVFDVGKVLVQWDLRHLLAKLVDDPVELDWVCANVVTPEWHFEHDAGRPLDEMVPERIALFPDHAHLIHAYRAAVRRIDPRPGAGFAGTGRSARRARGAAVRDHQFRGGVLAAVPRRMASVRSLPRCGRLRRGEIVQARSGDLRAGGSSGLAMRPAQCCSSMTMRRISQRPETAAGRCITLSTRRAWQLT